MVAEVVAVVSGVGGVVTGLAGLVVAIKATRHADEANRIARDANGLSRDANQIAERALGSSEQMGRDQIALHERQLELVDEAERRKRSAHLHVSPGPRSAEGTFNLRVENGGPHRADRLTLSLQSGDRSVTVGTAKTLRPGESTVMRGRRGDSLYGAIAGEDDDLSHAEGQTLELWLDYVDGNGPKKARMRVTISPGSRFVDRAWSIDDWPEK